MYIQSTTLPSLLLFPFVVLIYGISDIQAQQVVHIENKRLMAEEPGWSGSLEWNWEHIRSQNRILDLSTSAQLEYITGANVFLILNDIEWYRIDGENLLFDGYQHLRHNYKVTDFLAWESMVQTQFNEAYKIDFRGLAGTGPRLRLFNRESVMLYFGSLYMYEYQEISDEVDPRIAHRLSSYISFTFMPLDDLTFNLINYYQPEIVDIDDARISGEANLIFDFREWIAFVAGFSYFYDTRPAADVPNEFYSFTNGVRFQF